MAHNPALGSQALLRGNDSFLISELQLIKERHTHTSIATQDKEEAMAEVAGRGPLKTLATGVFLTIRPNLFSNGTDILF